MQDGEKDLATRLRASLAQYKDRSLPREVGDKAGQDYGLLLNRAERLPAFDNDVAKALLESDWGPAGSAFHNLCKKANPKQILEFFDVIDDKSKSIALGRLFNYGTKGLEAQIDTILHNHTDALIGALGERVSKGTILPDTFTDQLSNMVKHLNGGNEPDLKLKKMFNVYAKELAAAKKYGENSKIKTKILKQIVSFFKSIIQTRYAKKALTSKAKAVQGIKKSNPGQVR